ncbi:putative amidase [Mytilinidion resinicola]|uniref:Amidase n=1 Tax=Mytilinidion resinicola TaxID=574789 RepID=A0A6A6YFS1_9PEZI|nr:putative amidase [Mytilinidion resinicola]KAF2807642.1 putative amidase [Mytilinidion resinicola]
MPKAIAIERDQQHKDGKTLGALHSIPLLAKDIFVTMDKMETTGGSSVLIGAKYDKEAFIISRLRQAGAIILGKTNLSQWGMARSPKCPSGWTALFGQAVGGFQESQDPQGSSSGSAIAASLNLASGTIGGETCGSILYPAQRNGVVGLKPTVGLTSRSGAIPLNPEQDSVGTLTRWVKDSALILQVIAGKDEDDSASADVPFEDVPDYVVSCTTSGLEGLQIVVPKSAYAVADSDPEVGVAFRDAIETIRGLGATIIDGMDFEHWRPSLGLREDLFGDVLLREAYDKFFGGLVENPKGVKNISDLIEYIKREPDELYEKFGAGWFESARDAPGNSLSKQVLDVKARIEHLGADMARLLDSQNRDLLLATSSTDLPLDLGRLPGISVVHNSQVTKGPNIPFTITFAGKRFSEEKLITAVYSFEQATKVVSQNKEKLIVQPDPSLLDFTEQSENKL